MPQTSPEFEDYIMRKDTGPYLKSYGKVRSGIGYFLRDARIFNDALEAVEIYF